MPQETPKAKLSILFGGCTEAGIKDINEDAFAAHLPAGSVRESKGAVACIADGVSCSDQAQLASRTSATTFIQDYLCTPDTWDVKMASAKVLSALNSWLFQQGQVASARHNGLVTTFSAVVLKSTTAHLLHCGDSRIYRLRKNQLVQLTSDHTLVHPNGSASLTRALGMDSELKVDYQPRHIQVGDIFVLTTDGVHASLNSEQLNEHLARLADSQNKDTNDSTTEGFDVTLEAVAKDIVKAALSAGSNDNLSCLLIKIKSLPLENIDETHRKLTRLAFPPPLVPGNKLDGYTVTKVIHSGTRSHIYLASHPRLRDPVVIKAPAENYADDPVYLEGFIREQWIGRRIDHPGVMKIMEPVSGSKFLYHLCEYIDGQTLRQWMHDHPEPDFSTVREMAKQIASCVRAFQRMGMLHRDLKPENIMLDKDGGIKLIDFGTVRVRGLEDIASVINEDVPVGTADYVAPELLTGDKGLYRSDIFSTGVIIYEMLTGSLPYKPPSRYRAHSISYSHWQYQPAQSKRQDIPLWLDLALKKACSPRPTDRYEALSAFISDIQSPNKALLARHESAPLIERHPVRFWQVVSAILLLIIILQWV